MAGRGCRRMFPRVRARSARASSALCARVARVVRARRVLRAQSSPPAMGVGRSVTLSVTSGRVRLTCVRAPEEIIFIIII